MNSELYRESIAESVLGAQDDSPWPVSLPGMLCLEISQIHSWFSHSLTSTLSPQQSGCLHWCRSCLVVAQLLFESLVAELSVAELSVVVSSVVVSLDVGLLVAESSVPGL